VSESFRVAQVTPLLQSRVFDVERRLIEHDGTTFDSYVLEIPAGTLDVKGEEPLAAAKRELREELGCDAQTWRLLGRFKVSPGWTDQVMTIYEARDIIPVRRQPDGPEERSSLVEWVPISALKETLAKESTNDYTLTVAMHRVFGTLFDDD